MLNKMLKRLLREEKGQSVVIMAMAIVVLLGITAFSVDVGYLFFQKRHLQNTADAAALAGAQELPDNTDEAINKAKEYAELNGYTLTDEQISFENDNKRIVVSTSIESNTYFARVLSSNFKTVNLEALAGAELGEENLWDGVGLLESYQKKLILKGAQGPFHDPNPINIFIDNNVEGFIPTFHANDIMEIEHNEGDVVVNVDVFGTGSAGPDNIDDKVGLFKDTRQVAWKVPPITPGNLDDRLADFESQGYEVIRIDDDNYEQYDFVENGKIELKHNDELDFRDYANTNKPLVVYFSGLEFEMKDNSKLIGTPLLILDCKFEIKETNEGVEVGSALHVFSQGPETHDLEFKDMTATFHGPILVDGKIEIKEGANISFNLTQDFWDELPYISIPGGVKLVR